MMELWQIIASFQLILFMAKERKKLPARPTFLKCSSIPYHELQKMVRLKDFMAADGASRYHQKWNFDGSPQSVHKIKRHCYFFYNVDEWLSPQRARRVSKAPECMQEKVRHLTHADKLSGCNNSLSLIIIHSSAPGVPWLCLEI